MDSNGYAKSLFNTSERHCYLCPYEGDTARHEVYDGADRKTSKATGMWINLCPKCHEIVHKNQDDLHEIGQRVFERDHTHGEFITLFGKNYL